MAKKSDLTFCRDRNGFEAGQSSGEWEKVKRVLIVNGSIKPMLKNAENEAITIRAMRKTDPQVFYETYLSYGWHPQIRTYENYYKEQEAGTRKVFIAEYEGNVAGLCTLVPDAGEGPWAGMGFPEIADLSVFSDYRNAGIGNLLLDAAESEAFKLSDMVYLAVGVHSGYGAAQRIYVKRGYNFDGSGVWYQNKPLEQYAQCVNDDDLLLFMSKEK